MGSTARRVRDFAAYLVIALAIGFGLIWFADHSHGLRDDFIVKWGGLSVNTAILYGYFVSWSKQFWRIWGFWLATVSVLIVHLLVFVVILQSVDRWGTLWFLPMYPVELAILSIVCDWAAQRTGTREKHGLHTNGRSQ
jgi:cell division protein FtsW (lipid II flippase)